MGKAELGFRQSVVSAFEFLVRDYGFRCVESIELCVRYESERVYLNIYHGKYDFEVGLHFGRLGTNETFDFTLFVRRFCPALEQAMGLRSGDTAAKVKRAADALAEAFRNCGQPIINADHDVFEQMAKVRWWHFSPRALGRQKS